MAKGLEGLKGLKGLKPIDHDQQLKDFSKQLKLLSQQTPDYSEFITETPVKSGTKSFGKSKYDPLMATTNLFEDIGLVRGTQLGAGVLLFNGLAKGTVLAGTTFLDGTVGLLVGGATALSRGEFSGLWDNEFSRAMKSVNEWSEGVLPNYYTREESDPLTAKGIFNANFIGDKFIKNLGFSVGAYYSGGVFSKLLAAPKITSVLNNVFKNVNAAPYAKALVGSTMGAFNEGRIEALNNSTEYYEFEKLKLDEANELKKLQLIAQYGDTEMINPLLMSLQEDYQRDLEQLELSTAKMGNMNLLTNLPILIASNAIQFGKAYAGGFKSARRSGKVIKKAAGEGSEEAVEYATKMTKNKALVKSLLNPFSEGGEEMGQRVSSTFSANYESEKLNNFYNRKIDPKAEEDSVNWIKTLATSLNETVNDKSAWEEFLIGSLTGFMGIPLFQGVKNDKGDFQSPVKLNGGVFGGYREYRDEMKKQQEIVDYLNERVQDPNFKNYYQSLIRHNSFLNQMDEAAERDDPFDYKNAEDALFLNDIMMFDNAGAIDDLITLINTSLDTSDENLESIINNTTSTIEKEDKETIYMGRFVEKSGVKHTDTPELKKQMIEKLNSDKEEMIKNVNDYLRIKNEIDELTNERFTNDLLQELTWLKYQVNRWDQRKEEIGLKSKPFFLKLLGALEQNIRVIDEVLLKEGESNKGITEKFKLFQKKKKNHESVRDVIKSIFDDGNNYSIATNLQRLNEEKFKSIAEELLKENTINQQEYEETIKNFSDVLKMNEMQDRYNSRLQTYYKNPDILAEELLKQDEEVKNQHVQKILEKFKDVNTVKDLRSNLKSVKPELLSSVLDALEKSENTASQKLVRDYKDLEEAKAVMDNLFNDYLDSADSSLKDVFDTLLNEVNSLEEFEQALKEDLNEIPEEFKESFKTIIEKYNDIKKSKKTTEKKKATKKPQSKKKTGAKKKKSESESKDGERDFSLDNLSSDPNKPDKQQSETSDGKKDETSDKKKDEASTKKADIERRRQEKLKSRFGNHVELISSKNNTVIQRNGLSLPNKETYPPQKVPTEKLFEEYDKINAEYDAELKALEQQSNQSDIESKIADIELRRPRYYIKESKDKTKPLETFRNGAKREWDGVSVITGERMQNLYTGIQIFVEAYPEHKELLDKFIENENGTIAITNINLSFVLNTLKRQGVTTERELGDKINAKYDAMIDALLNEQKVTSTPTSVSSSSEESVDSSTPQSGKDEQKQSEDSVLRSWADNLTLYDFNLLKGDERKAVQRSNAAINALIKLGAYSFVDSGKLGKLVNKLESGFRKKEKIKIHYVLSKDPNLNNVILLAIELTPDVLKTVKSGDNPITIDGKQYQVVGTLGSNKTGKVNHEQIRKGLVEESSKGFIGDYFISNKFSNEIKHIYSGRMVKSVEGEPVSKRPVNKSFLSKNGLNKLHLGFYYSDGDFRTPSIDNENELIEVPNYNNTNPRQGSVWLMVQEADGIWYPKYVEVKRFTKLDFNLEENLNTPILKNIIEQLKIITDINKNVQDRLKARTVLENILYFGKNIDGGIDHKIFFTEKLDKQGNIIDVVVNVKDIKNNIGAGTDQLTKIQLILEALQDPSLNLRFQIKPAQFSSDNTINDILESGILVTDLYQPMNVNASFDLYLNDIETGGIIKKEEEGIQRGHTGKKGVNSSLTSTTVFVRGSKYSIKENGETLDSNNELVTNEKTLKEIDSTLKIMNFELQPFENSNLYIDVYNNGEEFGIKNGRVIVGKTLIKEKQKILDRVEKQKKKENLKNVINEDGEVSDDFFERATKKSVFGETGEVTPVEKDEDGIDADFFERAEQKSLFNSAKTPLKAKKESKKEIKPEPKKQSKPKVVKGNAILENVSDNIEQSSSINEKFEEFLRDDLDKMIEVLDKLGVEDIQDAMNILSERTDLPNIKNLNTNDQFNSYINNILECR